MDKYIVERLNHNCQNSVDIAPAEIVFQCDQEPC